jgi:hypothetical protein
VISRKRKIIFIQILIFLTALTLIYFTYYNKNTQQNLSEKTISREEIIDNDKNSFEDVEYKGTDLNGNRYVVQSEIADFELETPELINMQIMKTYFYFKDGTTLYVQGKNGIYNNKTFDIKMWGAIEANYLENDLFSDNLDYSNKKGIVTITGNVKGESIKGDIVADQAIFDLTKKTLDISMFDEKQVNIKVNNR